MEVISSFQVDHTDLKPGIYISRQDKDFTTYDIRMTAPNQEPVIDPATLHTIEHLVATYLRNHKTWKDRVVYWGPMGCCTGNYLIMKGFVDIKTIRCLMIDAFRFVSEYIGELPGSTPATCGNYTFHNLPMAQWEAVRFIDRLKNEFHHVYKMIERPDVKGLNFHDA